MKTLDALVTRSQGILCLLNNWSSSGFSLSVSPGQAKAFGYEIVGNELFRTVCTRSGKADWLFFNSIAQMTEQFALEMAATLGQRFRREIWIQACRSAKIEPEQVSWPLWRA